jgi:AcrR family transcriptional regulator
MGQVKKEAVRTRILDAAARLFEEKGYVSSTTGQIAERAGLSVANIYVYFPSKIDIAFAIFEPWMAERISQIEMEAASIRDPQKRLAHVLARLWRDIPYERNNYFNNFIQAIAVTTMRDGYKPSILLSMRGRIRALIYDCLPETRRDAVDIEAVTHIAIMAFDGFVINGHLDPKSVCTSEMIEATCKLLLGAPLKNTAKMPKAIAGSRLSLPARKTSRKLR